ncbi:zinc ribbon domain-containing protein [Niastella koreensis]
MCTEKDGSRNSDYCKYCHANGEFTGFSSLP